MRRREFLSGTIGATALLVAPELFPREEENVGTAFLCDSICLKHDTGENHVERADRITAIENKLKENE